MEPAIPEHLREARSCPARLKPGFEPPYPFHVARHRPSVRSVVMAYFGVQVRPELKASAAASLASIADAFDATGHWDGARCLDARGVVDRGGEATGKSFGMSSWRGLADLEA